MTKKKIADIYFFLAAARLSRLNDDEKIAVIRLLREMKPVATDVKTSIEDAYRKASEDNPTDQAAAMRLAEKALEGVLTANIGIETRVLSEDAFQRLCLSNDWTFGQIDELEPELVTT